MVPQDVYLFNVSVRENIRLGRADATDDEVAAAMVRARHGRTTLVIAHRLSTIRAADRVVVLADGRVAETGTHDQLLARDSAYAALIASQLDRVLDATDSNPPNREKHVT